ncbi:poly-gamma-glutamate capsule biosynthesis protein CapA/YwtB (metallophosphatase superfamily) [Anaerotaenia torta]|uniref:CapA family protein n=1 Tax=Anaerotaenia torta TaxID=433293 RepID=UPI003D1984C8
MSKHGLTRSLLGLGCILIMLARSADPGWASPIVRNGEILNQVQGEIQAENTDQQGNAEDKIEETQPDAGQTDEMQTADESASGKEEADEQPTDNEKDKEQTAGKETEDEPASGEQIEDELTGDGTDPEEGGEAQEDEQYGGKIILSAKSLSLQQGKSAVLTAELTEENQTDEELRYQSSDTKVATVNQSGKVKAVHWGSTTITVTLGKARAKCKVTVSKDITLTISAAGDCTLSSDIKQPASVNFFSVYNKKKDDAYFFKNVKPIFEKDDMTIVNFEGTLSNQGKREDKKWAFRGKPSYINILKEGSVEAVAFANNHVRDYGEISYTDTIKSFGKAGLVYSSYETIGVYEVKGMKIGMVSIQETGRTDSKTILRKALKTVKKEKPDLLIVSFHWGIEKSSRITKAQRELGRIAVDEGGADLVLGHHPHVLQPVEKYKDAYIVYSLGNFCFGGNTNPADKDTMIFQQTFTFHNDELVQTDDVRIIPCSVSSTSQRNNYQPTPSTGKEKTRILKKINGYCGPYGITFDKNGRIILSK